MQIAVHNLTKLFGTLRANDGLSLSFAGGQIHGVLGENGAGKSTLMKLISGYMRPDAGTIAVDGQTLTLAGPGDALRAGIGMVHQEPLDVPGFTALENLLCAAPGRAIPHRAAGRSLLTRMAERLHFTLDPDTPIAQMTVGQRQQLEIVRLLACGARTLILDEPTTGITAAQARALFIALRQLVAEGRTVLFVSHKLDEVAELCHTVSILRAGRAVEAQLPMPQPQERLLQLMFGSNWTTGSAPVDVPSTSIPTDTLSTPIPPPVPAVATWRLEGVTAREGNVQLQNLTLELPPGRIIGLAGLDGSGQQILLRLLAGRMRPEMGRVLVSGVDLTTASAIAYRQAGIEYLPADRMLDGVVGAMSLTDHFALLQRGTALVDWPAAERQARAAIAGYAIKATPQTPLLSLSGGNQQRAMLALVPADCRGLACEQPTRGLDVASARAIWARLLDRRTAGCTIVFASPDLDELMTYSDEVLVFFAGRVSQPLPRTDLSSARLAELIGGVGFVNLAQSN